MQVAMWDPESQVKPVKASSRRLQQPGAEFSQAKSSCACLRAVILPGLWLGHFSRTRLEAKAKK